MRKSTEQKITAGLVAGSVFFLLLIFLTNLFHFNYCINADIASDVILGELIWNRREIIPDTWYVANELRIICTPDVAALFYGLTGNMVLASGLACCVMTILILAAVLYFSKVSGMKKIDSLLMCFLCLVIPSGFIMLELFYLFAGYYAIHVVVFFVTLAMYITFLERRSMACKLWWVGVLLAFLLGLQGVRGILVIYGPLFGIELIRNIYVIYQKRKRSSVDLYLSLWVLSLLIVSYLGTLFPFSVGQGFSRNIRKGIQKLFMVVVPDMGRAIGFKSAALPGKICLGILLLLTLYVLMQVLRLMWKREEIEPIYWGWMVVCASPVVSALMVAFTTVESTERYYFILLLLLPFSAVLVWRKSSNVVKCTIGALAILLALSNLVSVYLPVLKSNEPPLTEEYQVTEFLEEKGLLTAYATFENANTMTVLSNGSVRVYPVATVEKMDICKWMASTDWYCPNVPFEQKTAYIITDAEKDNFYTFLNGKDGLVNEVGKIGKYTIYVSDYNYSNLGKD